MGPLARPGLATAASAQRTAVVRAHGVTNRTVTAATGRALHPCGWAVWARAAANGAAYVAASGSRPAAAVGAERPERRAWHRPRATGSCTPRRAGA